MTKELLLMALCPSLALGSIWFPVPNANTNLAGIFFLLRVKLILVWVDIARLFKRLLHIVKNLPMGVGNMVGLPAYNDIAVIWFPVPPEESLESMIQVGSVQDEPDGSANVVAICSGNYAFKFDLHDEDVAVEFHRKPRLWDAAWNSILTFLFPVSQGFFIAPRRRQDETSDLVIGVVKMINHDPSQMRIVLIVQIKSNWRLQSGFLPLEEQINSHIDAAFRGERSPGTAISKVYWITTIGPRWRYGIKEDGEQGLRPLIAWHETTHDQASYGNFQALTSLVVDLCGR
ncbi:hypothetical protein EDB87DRAFT_1573849 [Lactarius vividus]|nr:hypothetical protein EDB87DRAFT_1573849 [Lactarius vividus]